MHDVVLLPTYNRPEYLHVCLEHIQAARGTRNLEIIVQHDRHVGQPMIDLELSQKVAGQFGLQLNILQAHRSQGNSYNVFSLYRRAMEMADVRYIYLIEDDVIVSPDFFDWHENVRFCHEGLFATVGWKCIRNPEVKFTDDSTALIVSARDYASIGVCWTKDQLETFVAHDVPAYHDNPSKYLAKVFPGSPIPAWQWTEQDGIITRMLQENKNRWVVWPVVPRCIHVGVSGYHRQSGHRFTGTIEDRIYALKHAIKVPGQLAGLSKDPFNDVFIQPEIAPYQPWDLHVAHRFPFEAGKI